MGFEFVTTNFEFFLQLPLMMYDIQFWNLKLKMGSLRVFCTKDPSHHLAYNHLQFSKPKLYVLKFQFTSNYKWKFVVIHLFIC
jgi:hypothetical protein